VIYLKNNIVAGESVLFTLHSLQSQLLHTTQNSVLGRNDWLLNVLQVRHSPQPKPKASGVTRPQPVALYTTSVTKPEGGLGRSAAGCMPRERKEEENPSSISFPSIPTVFAFYANAVDQLECSSCSKAKGRLDDWDGGPRVGVDGAAGYFSWKASSFLLFGNLRDG